MYCLSTFCSVCLEGGKELKDLNSVDIDDIPILNKLIFVCFGYVRILFIISMNGIQFSCYPLFYFFQKPIDINTLKFICKSCLKMLRTSYQFKRMSLLNNDLLRGYIAQLKYFTGTKGSYGNTVVSLIRTEDDVLEEDASDVNENIAAEFSKVEKVNKTRPCKFQCKVCGLTFGRSILRLLHFNKYHTIKKKKRPVKYLVLRGNNGYSCQYCSKVISSKSRLFQHLIIHKDVNNITCDYCPMVCHMKQGYEDHVCVDHGVEINKFCSICNKVVSDYIRHMSEHITPRIKCPYCTKVFFTERTCIYHVNIDHWEYQCSLCGKLCFSESSVLEHIKSHNATIEIMNPLSVGENEAQTIDLNALLHDQREILEESINTPRTYKKPGPKSKTLNQTKTASSLKTIAPPETASSPIPPPKKRKKSEIGFKNMESQSSNVRKKTKLMGPKSRRAKIAANENIAQHVEQAEIDVISDYPAPKNYQTKMDQYIHECNLNWQTKRVHTKKHVKRESQVKCTHCLITFASNKSLITHKCFSSNTYQCPKCKVVYIAQKSFRIHMIKCLKKKLNPSSSRNLTIPQNTQDMSMNSMQSDSSLGTNGVVVKEELFSEDSVKVEMGDDTPVLLNPFSQFVSNANEQVTDVVVIEDNYNPGDKHPTSDLEAAVSGDNTLIIDEEGPMEVDTVCENVAPHETNLENNTEDQENNLIPPNEEVTLIQVEKPRDNIIDLSSEDVPEIRVKMEFSSCDAPDSTVPEVVDSRISPSSVDQPASEYISASQIKEPRPDYLNTIINHNFQLILPKSNNSLSDTSNSSETVQENANLSCNMCEAKFPTVALLTSHLLVHTYQTSMKCSTCKKVFLTQYDLDKHIMFTYRTGCGEKRLN